MDPASLITATTLECAGWLKQEASNHDSSGDTNAGAAQDGLVGIVRSAMRQRRAPQHMRASLFEAINATSKWVIDQVPGAIDEVRHSGASYLMEFEAIDETIREVYGFEQLPFIGVAHWSFKWMARLRELPQRQQVSVMQLLDLELELWIATVCMGNAEKDGDVHEQEKLGEELRKLVPQVAQIRSRLNPDALTAKFEIQEAMSHMEIQTCPPVIEVVATSKAAEVRFAAVSMDDAGDSLIQSLPITQDTRPSSRRKAAAAWARLSDLGNTLHVLAIWLRALAEDEESRMCVLCYRHIGYRGKNFCAEHQRKGGKRQSARIFHIARLYPDEIESLSKSESGLKAAMANAEQVKDEQVTVAVTSLPEGITIPKPLSQAASILIVNLRRASPAMGPELEGLVEELWKELVRIAAEPYEFTTQGSKNAALRCVRQEKARRWLNWNTFFRAWWAKSYEGPDKLQQILTGRAYDIDHPISHGYVVPPGGVVIDLLRQRAWTRAEQRVEAEAYVSVYQIRTLRKDGKSLRAVGKSLNVSHETVRKTLIDAAVDGPLKAQRQRARSSFTSQQIDRSRSRK